MHRLIKIRIVRDLEHLEERVRGFMERLEPRRSTGCFRPAADFYETTRGLVLRLDLAGVAAEDVSVSLAGQELLIRGRRKPPPPEGIRRFILLEIAFGAFERRFPLPIPVDPDKIRARYADGVLEVELPRKAPVSRTITVRPVSERE